MRVAVASMFGNGLSFWLRLAAEGCDVRVWIADPEQREIGDGLVTKLTTWPHLFDWAKQGALAGEPTLVLFDSSGMGEQADQARRWGLHVIGAGAFCDKLEKDRSFGFEVARNAGASLPEYKDFESFDAARSFAQDIPPDESVYWKSDRFLESDATHKAEGGQQLVEYLDSIIRRFGPRGSNMIQETIEGVAISTARWWNGRTFVGPFEGTLEHKKALNDDLGPATGCAFNALWFYENEPAIAFDLGFDKLETLFMREQAPPGIYDMNSMAGADGKAYFLEWTPRFGYDSEPTSLCLWPNVSEFLWAVATGTDMPEPSYDLAYALRLTVPPYPWEHAKREYQHGAMGVEVRDCDSLWEEDFLAYNLARNEHGLYVASPEGIIGLAYAQGGPLSELDDAAQETAKGIRVAGLQYRTDGADAIRADAQKMLEAGFVCPRELFS